MARDIHLVMLPWSAFGHLMPFFQLSVALAKAGVHVSFVSTPRNIHRLPKLNPNIAALMNLVELPLPPSDQNILPEGAEATVDIPFEKIQYLKVSYDLLEQPFRRFVTDWIIADVTPHWAVDVAQECSVPLIIFYAFCAAFTVISGPPQYMVGDGQKRVRGTPESLTAPPEWVNFPSTVAYRSYEAIGVYTQFFEGNASGITDAQRAEYLVVFLLSLINPSARLLVDNGLAIEVDSAMTDYKTGIGTSKPLREAMVSKGEECGLCSKSLCDLQDRQLEDHFIGTC
ncbi:unnamed protein product [Ilex paraguariensis]|uniref:Uncharacterized protein n=1 Tax=Ilex paraguariensis TaxID=185542 RepID=A0ABC8QSN5_9AQUA